MNAAKSRNSQARVRTVMDILKLDACEYEKGKGHGPAAFANFAYYRAGRADLAGKSVDDVAATGIRKAASREHGSKAYNARNALIKWLNKRLDYANAPLKLAAPICGVCCRLSRKA